MIWNIANLLVCWAASWAVWEDFSVSSPPQWCWSPQSSSSWLWTGETPRSRSRVLLSLQWKALVCFQCGEQNWSFSLSSPPARTGCPPRPPCWWRSCSPRWCWWRSAGPGTGSCSETRGEGGPSIPNWKGIGMHSGVYLLLVLRAGRKGAIPPVWGSVGGWAWDLARPPGGNHQLLLRQRWRLWLPTEQKLKIFILQSKVVFTWQCQPCPCESWWSCQSPAILAKLFRCPCWCPPGTFLF